MLLRLKGAAVQKAFRAILRRKGYLSHDVFVNFDFRLGPVDPGDLHAQQEHFSGNEPPACEGRVAMGVVLGVEVAFASERCKLSS